MRIVLLVGSLLLLPVAGCDAPAPDPAPEARPDPFATPDVVRMAPEEGSPEGDPAPADLPRVVFLGTSLTEGLGLADPDREAWPARVAALAGAAGIPILAVNAGVSGETSAGALRRIAWVLREPADLLVVETGANDGLRGLPVAELASNLEGIVTEARNIDPDLPIAVVSMEAPPNLGPEYADAFRAVYARVGTLPGVTLLPFALDGVAGVPERNQADGIHPTAEGHRIMAENVWPALSPLLSEP